MMIAILAFDFDLGRITARFLAGTQVDHLVMAKWAFHTNTRHMPIMEWTPPFIMFGNSPKSSLSVTFEIGPKAKPRGKHEGDRHALDIYAKNVFVPRVLDVLHCVRTTG
jgi:hypothetical protein